MLVAAACAALVPLAAYASTTWQTGDVFAAVGNGSYKVYDNASDTYRIRLSDGYDSGEQVLNQGNVQIHK